MTDFNIDTLLEDISSDAPCGEDISYDVNFLDLERLAAGKAATQVGDHVQEGEEPDWKQVHKLSLELLERSRDLRLILFFSASALRLEGLPGFRNGLALLRSIVERHWDHLHPQLDPDDGNDPLERMNIIGSLSPSATMMSDQDPMKFIPRLMEIPLCTPEDARLPRSNLRHMLIASGELSVSDEEFGKAPSIQVIEAAFEQTDTDTLKNTDQALLDCLEHLNALDNVLVDHVGAGAAPNLDRLGDILKQMQSRTDTFLQGRNHGSDVSSQEPASANGQETGDAGMDAEFRESASGGGTVGGVSGRITSSRDVVKALDMILDYYKQNEVSSPIPLLIKRAKRLVGRSFVDIIRDISPDALSQVQMVSGDDDLPDE